MLPIVSALFVVSTTASAEHGPFTKDFVSFLNRNPSKNEYILSSYKTNGDSGTFGGRSDPDEQMNGVIEHHPVLFVHGNSDSALYHSSTATGWTKSVEYFKEKGYTSGELYGLTYGSRDINHSLQSSITCRNLVGTRRFIEAILAYTQSEKIDIIAHSMGVTLARKAIQGGTVVTTSESCDIGRDLSDKIDALVAISGANYGMCMCLMDSLINVPACAAEGFGPGTCSRNSASMTDCGEEQEQDECTKNNYSSILRRVNAHTKKEASFVASLWSADDNILGKGNIVWGRHTSKVPHSDLTHAYKGLDHFQSKDKTTHDQYHLVTAHTRHTGRSRRHQN